MTPQEVGRIIQAGLAQSKDAKLTAILRAMAEQCAEIGAEQDSRDHGGVHGPECAVPIPPAVQAVADAASASYLPGPVTGVDYGEAFPTAEAQHSADGQFHRVVVYFGGDEQQAEHFARWVMSAEWASFAKWRLRQTVAMPAVPDNAPQEVIHGTCHNEGINHLPHYWGGGRFHCDGDVGVPADVLRPADWSPPRRNRTPADRVTAPLLHVKGDPAETYHEFEPSGEGVMGEAFCKHCPGSAYAEQHVLAKAADPGA